MRRALLWGPPIVYMVLIFHFSSESNPMPELTEHVWDKLLHLTEYAGLALLFARALVGEGLNRLAAIVFAIVLTSFYGATDEYHQLFVPMRDSDVRDWIADTLGASVGAIAYVTAYVASRRAGSNASDSMNQR
jgi:VanZ family protein